MKPSIPALKGPGGGLVGVLAEKASVRGSQFDSSWFGPVLLVLIIIIIIVRQESSLDPLGFDKLCWCIKLLHIRILSGSALDSCVRGPGSIPCRDNRMCSLHWHRASGAQRVLLGTAL